MQDETPEPEFTGTATYCPEDNKIRLYVGRVPRDEYLKLKAEGWTSTAKQTCDFVAVWTPERRDTALGYAGILEDEDASPADRAADRAERFSGYRDKRMGEATGHADRYDSGPRVHGFQDYGRAVRAADRHDRIAGRAVDSWSKAEYWQRRTAGVIDHALHLSAPAVRMGRIKELELQENRLKDRTDTRGVEWLAHTRLRLAYENQMLVAVGGRAACVEMEVGGWIGGEQIHGINRSPVTKNIVSVKVLGERSYYNRENKRVTKPCFVVYNIERLASGAYRAPTPEEIETFKASNKARKAAAPKAEPCPLINPTVEDAQKMQNLWNEANKSWRFSSEKVQTVIRMTQAEFSGGRYETRIVTESGAPARRVYGSEVNRHNVFKVRAYYDRIIIITDKPQKPVPWDAVAAARAKCPTIESMTPHMVELAEDLRAPNADAIKNQQLFKDAIYTGLAFKQSWSQYGLTEAGRALLATLEAATV